MSGTQSTLTDRTPNILNKDHPPDKKPKSDKSPVSLKHEFDPTGLVQRCVIIQRDENGFGLTVSGDNPVFVQLVREDGAAMRAGVQTGDRIIKVNGTLVTHSNHIEVVKLIKSGSYVALTVLGRPPGLPHIPLEEVAKREQEEQQQGEAWLSPSPSSPLSPLLPAREDHSTSPLPPTEDNGALQCQNADSLQKTKEQGDSQTMKEDHSRNPQAKLLKETQEAGRHHPLLQDQDGGSAGLWSRDGDVEEADPPPTPRWDSGSNGLWPSITGHGSPLPQSICQKEMPSHGPKITPLDGLICPSADPQETTDLDANSQCIVGSPSPRIIPQIIGAEDDYFDAQQEQISGQCSCFQSIESLKSRPAHLAAFLHHVVSQFDPAPLLCYLYADLHKQSTSKETRRLFMDFHSVFLDRAANLKVPVPDSIAAELERRRLDLIPEELCRQYTQLLQDTLLPDLHMKLEDFRQKRSMGLTLAEDMLCKLDSDKRKEQSALDKERSCAEHIISKIEDILMTSQPTEEEKCATMQYVILTYMKHLGVKVKEPRSLEPKRVRINFLPKMKKSSKPEKEGEEKVKKPRFPSILGQPRRPSRVDAPSIGKAMELNKQRSPKQLVAHPAVGIPEHPDTSSSRVRGSQSSDGSDSSPHLLLLPHPASPLPATQLSEPSGHDSDSGLSPFSAPSRLSDGVHSGDNQDGTGQPNSPHFDFPCPLDPFQEEVYRMEGLAEVQSEDDQGGGVVYGEDPLNWQRLVSREVLAGLTPLEIKRQEVINELLYTEGAHLRMLRVLDSVFYQRLSRDSILPPEDIKHIFTNLDQILQLHVFITEQMTAIRKRSETSVIGPIGYDLLTWFSGEEEEKIKQAVGTFCSNQPSALELIKSRQKKDQRFTSFMQEAESNRQCRRLQLKDIIPIEMQRLTKYPLLLESIAKYTEDCEERSKVKRACECCKKILNHVNQAVKEAENKQRLEEYQRRLDLASLKQSENPMISEFKNLDLTKRKMIHEGPLSWKVNKDKTIELYTLLLEDILVLLQRQDDRLVLKCHSKNLAGNSDTKHIFSPIIKLNTVLVRSVATDNKSFFVLSMSDNGAQIYELMAQTISDQRTWQCLITQCAETMKTKPHNNIIPLSQTEADRDAIEIINTEEPKPSKDSDCTSTGCLQPPGAVAANNGIPTDRPPSPGLQAPPTNSNPFEGDDEEEESALAEREEEVDEAELQAFLDGELPDGLTFLQETTQEGITANDQEAYAFDMPATRAEDALRTLAILKQVLLDHMKSREDAGKEETAISTTGCLLRTVSLGNHENSPTMAKGTCSGLHDSDSFETSNMSKETEGPELPTGHTGISVATESCGNYMVLDYPGGCEESNTDDDGVGGAQWDSEGDSEIDLKKLLSSASQTTEGRGPDLNRQIMTHLRLLQANLQHLKEVETKYNQLRPIREETATDSDEGNDTIQC